MVFLQNLWDMFVGMSFYLVIGILFTGVLHAFVSRSFIMRHVGGSSLDAVIKASVVGVPLPLCSCGVVPMALYLDKSGASKGATVSFLTSTPQTGLDSIIATYGMLGGFFAIFRAVVAFLSGIIAGCVTNIFCAKDIPRPASDIEPVDSCCSGGSDAPELASIDDAQSLHCCCTDKVNSNGVKASCSSCHQHTQASSSCSCTTVSAGNDNKSFVGKVKSIFTYGFGEFLDEIVVNFLVGIVIASLITTLVPDSVFVYFSNTALQMLLMLVVSIPMYVCSTSSIPIAVALVIKGLSPGAAFVLLFAGPATNIASLSMLTKNLGKKVMAIYLSCMAVCAVIFGLLLDLLIDVANYTGLDDVLSSVHGSDHPTYQIVVAVIFGTIVLYSLAKQILYKSSTHRHSNNIG